jgi:two-component system chemotaxis response regulator CheY
MLALVVDDSVTARIMLTYILKDLGFEVEQAMDGSSALERLAREPRPDLLTLDWNMPGLNGGQVLECIKQGMVPRPGRILVVTSETEMNVIRSSLLFGGDEYLMKPYSHESVLRKLEILSLTPSSSARRAGE